MQKEAELGLRGEHNAQVMQHLQRISLINLIGASHPIPITCRDGLNSASFLGDPSPNLGVGLALGLGPLPTHPRCGKIRTSLVKWYKNKMNPSRVFLGPHTASVCGFTYGIVRVRDGGDLGPHICPILLAVQDCSFQCIPQALL